MRLPLDSYIQHFTILFVTTLLIKYTVSQEGGVFSAASSSLFTEKNLKLLSLLPCVCAQYLFLKTSLQIWTSEEDYGSSLFLFFLLKQGNSNGHITFFKLHASKLETVECIIVYYYFCHKHLNHYVISDGIIVRQVRMDWNSILNQLERSLFVCFITVIDSVYI